MDIWHFTEFLNVPAPEGLAWVRASSELLVPTEVWEMGGEEPILVNEMKIDYADFLVTTEEATRLDLAQFPFIQDYCDMVQH